MKKDGENPGRFFDRDSRILYMFGELLPKFLYFCISLVCLCWKQWISQEAQKSKPKIKLEIETQAKNKTLASTSWSTTVARAQTTLVCPKFQGLTVWLENTASTFERGRSCRRPAWNSLQVFCVRFCCHRVCHPTMCSAALLCATWASTTITHEHPRKKSKGGESHLVIWVISTLNSSPYSTREHYTPHQHTLPAPRGTIFTSCNVWTTTILISLRKALWISHKSDVRSW